MVGAQQAKVSVMEYQSKPLDDMGAWRKMATIDTCVWTLGCPVAKLFGKDWEVWQTKRWCVSGGWVSSEVSKNKAISSKCTPPPIYLRVKEEPLAVP